MATLKEIKMRIAEQLEAQGDQSGADIILGANYLELSAEGSSVVIAR